MDTVPNKSNLQFNPNTIEEVRRDVNLHKQGEMKDAVRILQEWLQQQVHFRKKDLPPQYLESAILISKGSIERAKRIIDKTCTIKTLMPQYFKDYDAKEIYSHIEGKVIASILPKLTAENHRVVILKFFGKLGGGKILENLFKFAYAAIEYLRLHDYNSGIIVIYDLRETDLNDFWAPSNLNELRTFYTIVLEQFGIRMKKLHLITTSKLIDTFLSFFKPFIKKEIMDRVIVNKSADDLLQDYPREMLPLDYGGSEISTRELHDICYEELASKEHSDYMKMFWEARVDESLRPAGQFNELYAGTVGTFRSLTLD